MAEAEQRDPRLDTEGWPEAWLDAYPDRKGPEAFVMLPQAVFQVPLPGGDKVDILEVVASGQVFYLIPQWRQAFRGGETEPFPSDAEES